MGLESLNHVGEGLEGQGLLPHFLLGAACTCKLEPESWGEQNHSAPVFPLPIQKNNCIFKQWPGQA